MEYFHDRQEFSGIICEITIILFVGGQAGPAGRILSIIIYNPLQVQKQNEQLDRINKKAESDKMRVKMANDKAQALMK